MRLAVTLVLFSHWTTAAIFHTTVYEMILFVWIEAMDSNARKMLKRINNNNFDHQFSDFAHLCGITAIVYMCSHFPISEIILERSISKIHCRIELWCVCAVKNVLSTHSSPHKIMKYQFYRTERANCVFIKLENWFKSTVAQCASMSLQNATMKWNGMALFVWI